MGLAVEIWKRYFLTPAQAFVLLQKLQYSYRLIWQVIYNLL